MTNRQEEWFKTAVGRAMNLDGVEGRQCVDVPNDYAQWLFGDWEKTIGRGNAKDKFDIAPASHWDKIRNDPKNPNLIPQRGDVIVWPGSWIVSAGHTAVVTSAQALSVSVIEQSGGTNRTAYQTTHPYRVNGVLPLGWLRPKKEKMIGGSEMFVFARNVNKLKVKLASPIMMFNIETGAPLWNSGMEMELVAKTNIVHGSTFYVPVDRAETGEPFGFKEEDVYRKGNTVTEVKPVSGIDADTQRKLDIYEEGKRLFTQ